VVRDDEDILEAYEAEFATPLPRRSNRGFWLVAGAMIVAGVVLFVGIFANRGLKDTVAHAQFSLRTAQAQAQAVRDETGSFAGADATGLASRTGTLTFVGPDDVSRGLEELSVLVDDRGWAAAVSARPRACFYLRLELDGEVSYGAGTLCTGREAANADDSRW
jgi:hypothetical protein